MLRQSYLENSKSTSFLESASTLKPRGHKHKKGIAFELMLTSLVDAFAILVIFLIANTTNFSQVDAQNGVELPVISKTTSIEKGTVIIIDSNGLNLNGSRISEDQLVSKLKELKDQMKDEFSLIVQAHKNLPYEKLNPIIMASAHAGIESFKFAAIEGEKK